MFDLYNSVQWFGCSSPRLSETGKMTRKVSLLSISLNLPDYRVQL